MRGARPRPMRTSYDSSATRRSLIGTRITGSLGAGPGRLPLPHGGEAPDVVVQELALLGVVEGARDQPLGGLDRQVGHVPPQLLHRLLLLELHLPLPRLDEALRLPARLRQDLGAQCLGLALPLLDDGGRLAPRLRQGLLVPALRLLGVGPQLLRLVERLANRP